MKNPQTGANLNGDKVINVAIFVFPNIETLDFCGPLEVFSAANLATGKQHFHVYTFSHIHGLFKTINGLQIQSDYHIEDLPAPDIMAWPGGEGTKAVISDTKLLDKLNNLYEAAHYTFSVCSGARIPAILGLLNNKRFTTHHLVFDDVQKLAPTARPGLHNRFVDSGKILTSAGVSAGIDLSLYIVDKLKGRELAEQTAHYMEYVCGWWDGK